MTVSSGARKAGPYSCNGATTEFAFSFKVFVEDDVRVVLTDSDALESDLMLTTHYTVSLNSDQDANPGGSITTVTTYATGNSITLTSDVAYSQSTELPNPGNWYPKVVEDALDKLTVLCQQNVEEIGRCVKVDISSSTSPDDLLDDLAADVVSAAASADAASASSASASDFADAAAAYAANLPNAATAGANKFLKSNAAGDDWDYETATTHLASLDSLSSGGIVSSSIIQAQTKVAFTSSGTPPAFTVTTTPAYGAYASGQRMRVKFHASGTTGSNTLNRDGLGAKSLMQYDQTGAKVPAVVVAGYLADIEYDGTDQVLLNPLTIRVSPGVVVQAVEATPYSTYSSLTSVIPNDDTIPQNTEGTEFVTVSITPTKSTNRLIIEAVASMVLLTTAAAQGVMAIFQDSTASAIAAIARTESGYMSLRCLHEMAAGTTSPTTFRVRIGTTAGTLYINGNSSNRHLGGLSAIRLRVTEVVS